MPNCPTTCVIRADAGSRIGTGHVMRCLSLGQAWQDVGGEVVFVMANAPSAIEARLHAEKMRVEMITAKAGSPEDAQATIAIAERLEAPWIVVDGYQFDTKYQQELKKSVHKILWIDDFAHAAPYCADLILNQNVYATADLYPSCEQTTNLLLGANYVLLRREFREWRDWKRDIPEQAQKMLVTLGGSDPDNVTLDIIHAISSLKTQDIEIKVIAGATNPNFESLQAACDVSGKNIALERNVDNMPKVIAWADLAVTAGGSTSWEMAFMGLPSLVIILADNQEPIAEHLSEKDIACNLGRHVNLEGTEMARAIEELAHNPSQRRRFSGRGRKLVAGYGAERVVNTLLDGMTLS